MFSKCWSCPYFNRSEEYQFGYCELYETDEAEMCCDYCSEREE